jgi:hypothetical protein
MSFLSRRSRPNNALRRMALRLAAEPERWASKDIRYEFITSCPYRTGCPRSADTLFRMAQPGVSQVFGRRILRQRGKSILFLPCQSVGAVAWHRSSHDARGQRVALHPPFHLFLDLSLLRFYQKAEGFVVELALLMPALYLPLHWMHLRAVRGVQISISFPPDGPRHFVVATA